MVRDEERAVSAASGKREYHSTEWNNLSGHCSRLDATLGNIIDTLTFKHLVDERYCHQQYQDGTSNFQHSD